MHSLVKALVVGALVLLNASGARAQIGIMGAPSTQCVLQNTSISNTIVPAGVPSGTLMANVTAPTNATAGGTTWDPTFLGAGMALSNGNLTITGGTDGAYANTRSNTTQPSASGKKVYYRFTLAVAGMDIGGTNSSSTLNSSPGGPGSFSYITSNGQVFGGAGPVGTIQSLATGDYADIALDTVNAKIWIRTGSNQNWNNDVVANQDPATNTGGFSLTAGQVLTGPIYIFATATGDTDSGTLNPNPPLSGDPTLAGFSPWQPFSLITCGAESVSLTAGGANFSLVSGTPPTQLATNGTITAGTYNVTVQGSISGGAINSPLSVPYTITATTGGIEDPGPSTLLYNNPFYTCVRNFYVATTGSDSNSGTSVGSPWQHIQHADSASRTAGDCINVASGTYNENILNQNGGNAPTATGYVSYRCSTLDACHVKAPSANNWLWGIEQPANFIVIDGFELDGNSSTVTGGISLACVNSAGDTFGTGQSSHHIWIMNSLIHDCNLSGIALSNKEWYYVLHNTVYNNSWTSPFQGSGIDLVVVQCVELGVAQCASGNTYSGGTGTYVPSGMDLTYGAPYHILIVGNIAYGNQLIASNPAGCGSHTDGNGIIMDTFEDEATHKLIYPYQSLVWGNIARGNGARGIHNFLTSNTTVANNTAYGNGIDTCINGYFLGDLSNVGGGNNRWYNNVSQSVLTTANPSCGQFCGARNSPFVTGDGNTGVNSPNTYFNNMLVGGIGIGIFDSQVNQFSASNNFVNVSPNMVNPGSQNFALNSGSPAIAAALSVPGGVWSPIINVPSGGLSGQFFDLGACYHTLSTCP